MKVFVWNAFASNNSGSYTIVGSFHDVGVAEAVARELAEVIAAHSAWLEGLEGTTDTDGSPLAAFARQHGLQWVTDRGGHDDWPEYGPPPTVVAVGHQVVVHAPYTVSMPPTLGELFYARGGRVDCDLDHSHNPLVTHIEVSWPYQAKAEVVERGVAALLHELTTSESVSAALRSPVPPRVPGPPESPPPLRWTRGVGFGAPALTIGAVFHDLVAGVQAVRDLPAMRDVQRYRVRIFEALDRGAPLAHLELGTPASAMIKVVLDGCGSASRIEVILLLRRTLDIDLPLARELVDRAPVAVAALPSGRAAGLVDALRAIGAEVHAGADSDEPRES